MITNLHIKNIGIIEDIEINFNNGFNVLTGETGAGKTLIIDSLNTPLNISGNKVNTSIFITPPKVLLRLLFYYYLLLQNLCDMVLIILYCLLII